MAIILRIPSKDVKYWTGEKVLSTKSSPFPNMVIVRDFFKNKSKTRNLFSLISNWRKQFENWGNICWRQC